VFKAADAMKSSDKISYTYRTVKANSASQSTGTITLTLNGQTFPYDGVLGTSAEREFIVISRGDYQSFTNATGTVTTSTTSKVVTGSSTIFQTQFRGGDFVRIWNGSTPFVGQINTVTSNTSLTLVNFPTLALSSNNIGLALPKNVPISITSRTTRTATVTSLGTQVAIVLDSAMANTSGSATTANVYVIHNATTAATTASAKVPNRNIYARVKTSNNAAGLYGPWALGVSDVFRLRSVHQANSASVAKSFFANTTSIDGTTEFISIANNPFANGDAVIYSKNGGTAVTGLTDATTYYAVFASNTGMAVSATRNGSNVNLSAPVSTETHKFTGNTIYFTPNTYGVTDVTNNFYIDNNQNENYLDTS